MDLLANPVSRKILGSIGVPVPTRLERDASPWRALELAGRAVLVGFAPGAELVVPIAEALTAAGADPVVPDEAHRAVFAAAGEAWGRPPRAEAEALAGIVLDATGMRGPADLRLLHDLLQPRLRSLARSGRVIVLGRTPGGPPALAATRRALEGFVRALGRELGRFGSTAMLLSIEEGGELAPSLRFLLSPRAAFLSGQVWRLGAATAEPRWARPLEGRVVLVTGAARGIGAATVAALTREGARVVALDLDETCDAVPTYLCCNLAESGAGEKVAAFVRERFGKLDGVIHNAGITRDRMLVNMPAEDWDLTLDVNLGAVLRLHEALDPLLADGARIVCLSSIAGIAGNVGQTNYAASKAGIIGFVQALAPDVASRGITVNAIAPGFIETRMTAAIPLATREAGRRLANLAQGGLPEDIAEVATFLQSPGSSALSGQVLRVCGGSFVGA